MLNRLVETCWIGHLNQQFISYLACQHHHLIVWFVLRMPAHASYIFFRLFTQNATKHNVFNNYASLVSASVWKSSFYESDELCYIVVLLDWRNTFHSLDSSFKQRERGTLAAWRCINLGIANLFSTPIGLKTVTSGVKTSLCKIQLSQVLEKSLSNTFLRLRRSQNGTLSHNTYTFIQK